MDGGQKLYYQYGWFGFPHGSCCVFVLAGRRRSRQGIMFQLAAFGRRKGCVRPCLLAAIM